MRYLILLLLAPFAAAADPADLVDARAEPAGGVWRFSVTLAHPDTGWEHYADGWRVESADGTVLGTRDLLHPHVEEQPFTRSLSDVPVPAGTTEVFVRARCSVDGWGSARLPIALDPG